MTRGQHLTAALEKQAVLGEIVERLGNALGGVAAIGEAAGKQIIDAGWYSAIAAPLLTGIAAGVIYNKMTSPSDASLRNDEKEAVNAELDAAILKIKRDKAMQQFYAKGKPAHGKEIRI